MKSGQSGSHKHDRAYTESKVKSFLSRFFKYCFQTVGWQNVSGSIHPCPWNRQFTVTLQCDVFASYGDTSAFFLEILVTHWRKTRGTSFSKCGSHQLARLFKVQKWLGFPWRNNKCLSLSARGSYSYKGCQEKCLNSLCLEAPPPWTLLASGSLAIQAPELSDFLTQSATSGTRSTMYALNYLILGLLGLLGHPGTWKLRLTGVEPNFIFKKRLLTVHLRDFAGPENMLNTLSCSLRCSLSRCVQTTENEPGDGTLRTTS